MSYREEAIVGAGLGLAVAWHFAPAWLKDRFAEVADEAMREGESLASQVEDGEVIATGAMETAEEREAGGVGIMERSRRRRAFATTEEPDDIWDDGSETQNISTGSMPGDTIEDRTETRKEFSYTSEDYDTSDDSVDETTGQSWGLPDDLEKDPLDTTDGGLVE